MHSNGDHFNNFGPNHSQNNFNPNVGLSSGGSSSGVPPPLPPRPNALQNGSNIYRYGSYGSGFGPQMNNYSSYSPYSSYSSMYSCGPFNSPFGSYGFNGLNRFNNYSNENDFVRIAEESSRQAFQSIESIVQAFGSVSMMLESTYYAVHSSFRAVIGVADHFSRLRQHLAQIVSTLAIIRTLKWIIRRLLHLLGVRRIPNAEESAWNQASHSESSSPHLNPLESEATDLVNRGRSSWPIVIFFGVVFGTPWLIWRLLSTITGADKPASDKWMTGEDDHYTAIALYDFRTDIPRELPFSVGQNIIIAPKELQPRVKGWLLATLDGKKVGLIPANYVRIVGRNPKSPQQN